MRRRRVALALTGRLVFANPAVMGGCYYGLALVAAFLRRKAAVGPLGREFPSLSVLKPVHGAGDRLYEAVASHVRQDYPAAFEVLLGVCESDAAALEEIARVRAAFPDAPIRVVTACTRMHNAKVGSLVDMAAAARYPVLVINDAYNANPESMVAALRTATSFAVRGRKIAALGRMGELGEESDAGHRRVGRAVAELAFDYLITVGEEARLIAQAANGAGLKRTREANTHEQAVEALLDYLEPGDLLLVKGSLSSAMDRVIRGLEAAKGNMGWSSR